MLCIESKNHHNGFTTKGTKCIQYFNTILYTQQ